MFRRKVLHYHDRSKKMGCGYNGYEDRYRSDKVFRTTCINAGFNFLSYAEATAMPTGPAFDPEWGRGYGNSAAAYGKAPPEAQAAYKVYQSNRWAEKSAADQSRARGWGEYGNTWRRDADSRVDLIPNDRDTEEAEMLRRRAVSGHGLHWLEPPEVGITLVPNDTVKDLSWLDGWGDLGDDDTSRRVNARTSQASSSASGRGAAVSTASWYDTDAELKKALELAAHFRNEKLTPKMVVHTSIEDVKPTLAIRDIPVSESTPVEASSFADVVETKAEVPDYDPDQ
jgi:hypothetical protein